MVYSRYPSTQERGRFQSLQLFQGLRQLPRAAADYLNSATGKFIQQVAAGFRLAKFLQRYHNHTIQIRSGQADGPPALPVSTGKTAKALLPAGSLPSD